MIEAGPENGENEHERESVPGGAVGSSKLTAGETRGVGEGRGGKQDDINHRDGHRGRRLVFSYSLST